MSSLLLELRSVSNWGVFMHQKFACAIFLVIIAINSICPSSVHAASNDPLRSAVDLIDKNPKLAERKLLTLLARPTANVYLAYLYMSRKVTIAQAGKRIDALMNAAIANVSDQFALGEIDRSKHYHYKDMQMFLKHFRFITDADGSPVTIPSSIFSQYPAAAFEAFQPYWGSTRDSYLPIEWRKQDDIKELPVVSSFISTLEEMFGNPGSNCTGTIRYLYYRKQALALLEAGLAPQLFYANSKNKAEAFATQNLKNFLETWANEQLWNKQTWQQLNQQSQAAELPLAKFYQKRFGFRLDKAVAVARAALAGICLAYLDNYSIHTVNESRAGLVYQIFSRHQLSLDDMERQLGGKILTKEELAQALRLAILNDDGVEVINGIIKQGAPLAGGKEPPLFTAVMRPEVVSALLKAGADVNETNPIGKTALIQAAQFNASDTIKILLNFGADINHAMVKAGGEEAAAANSNCDFNYTIGSRTPLMYAAAFSGYPVIMYMLSKGADKSAVESEGATALKYLNWNKKLSKTERARLLQTLAL